MNKKLLLILSILMSLSLFTMSCAKSVTAPKNSTPYTPGQELTLQDVESILQTLFYNSNPDRDGKFIIHEATGAGINQMAYFGFKTATLVQDTFTKVYTLTPAFVNTTSTYGFSKSTVLYNLRSKLMNNGFFTPNSDWDDAASYTPTLTVAVSSSDYKIPDNLKTIKIELNILSSGCYWID